MDDNQEHSCQVPPAEIQTAMSVVEWARVIRQGGACEASVASARELTIQEGQVYSRALELLEVYLHTPLCCDVPVPEAQEPKKQRPRRKRKRVKA